MCVRVRVCWVHRLCVFSQQCCNINLTAAGDVTNKSQSALGTVEKHNFLLEGIIQILFPSQPVLYLDAVRAAGCCFQKT